MFTDSTAVRVRRIVSTIPVETLARHFGNFEAARRLKCLYELSICPKCAAGWDAWHHDWKGTVYQDKGPCTWRDPDGVLWVRWRCERCGHVFRRCEKEEG